MSALFTALVEGETKESLAAMVCGLRERASTGQRLLQAMHDQLEDAMCNCTNLDGQRWEYGISDLQLTPDGSVTLSDVRRYLASADRSA
jgi:hypothetical protein